MRASARGHPAHASAEDIELIDRVAEQFPVDRWQEPNVETLRGIASTCGLEVATALLWNVLRNSPGHGDLIRRVDAGDQPAVTEPPLVLIVPGAFHRHHPHTGADGCRLVRIADELGWPSERVELPSLGTIERNAAKVVKRLLDCPARRILVMSLSKGSCDVAGALRHPSAAEAFDRVCGWVSLSGILTGTPLVQWLGTHRLRKFGVQCYLFSRGLGFKPIEELRRSDGAPTSVPIRPPAHLRVIHVVGFPLRRHLRHAWAPRGYERLAPHGPNDGGGFLLGDATRLPGLIYPVWGADHYMNPAWDVVPALRSILLQASASYAAPSAIPATRSST